MRVKMKVAISGTRNSAGGRAVDWPPLGGEIEVPDGEGADLVASDMATEVVVEKKAAPVPKPEKKAAPVPVVETATGDDSKTEKAAVLTTAKGPTPPKRGPGRPRKTA